MKVSVTSLVCHPGQNLRDEGEGPQESKETHKKELNIYHYFLATENFKEIELNQFRNEKKANCACKVSPNGSGSESLTSQE